MTNGDPWGILSAGEASTGRAKPLAELVDRLRVEGRLHAIVVSGAEAGGDIPGGVPPIMLTGVADDSRLVSPGELFAALRGTRTDGHRFVGDAVALGCAAVIVETSTDGLVVPQLVVDRGSAALASAAAWWYGDPSRELEVVGVTGTNGKTTTAFLAATVLDVAGWRAGLVTTVGRRVGGEPIANESPVTTPGSIELQRTLRQMREVGDTAAVIETSSHGLAADRVASVAYDAAIFTNLSHEHLDFHGTFETYRAAKRSLFERLPARAKDGRPGLGVINIDDPAGPEFADATRATGARVLTYGSSRSADIRLVGVTAERGESVVDLTVAGTARRQRLGLAGRFNAQNAMAVLGLAVGWELDLDAVSLALATIRGVPGRMDRVERGQPFAVIVDFAHTPTALEAILRDLQVTLDPGAGIISVFGASGERDVGKRPLMGRAAGALSRVVIVTEDDSRHEKPGDIFEAIAIGAEAAGRRRGDDLLIVPDRRDAISAAFARARPGDVVLLAGKGHESWNSGPDGERPWNERAVAEAALAELGFKG